jgi:hypothetical protein
MSSYPSPRNRAAVDRRDAAALRFVREALRVERMRWRAVDTAPIGARACRADAPAHAAWR